MKIRTGIWALTATFLLTSFATPTANGLEFPMATTRLELPSPSANLTGTPADLPTAKLFTKLDAQGSLMSGDLAQIASISRNVELARSMMGAKRVGKAIAAAEYGWGDDEFKCLNRLWTKESHWNYQAHNYRSGAHGIAQALPATKMEVISSDWRTNPITQIRWGMHYISLRYDTPCGAWAKWQRKHSY